MLSRTSLRRLVPAAVVVFVVGAGAGAGVVIATRGGKHRPSPSRGVGAATTAQTRSPAPATTTAAPSPTPLLAGTAQATFGRLEEQLGGSVGLAASPLSGGPIISLGPAQVARAWSTSKVPVLVTLLSDYARRHQGLRAQQRSYAQAALEESDNAAIEALFADLERIHGGLVPASAAVQQMLRRAGDRSTVINVAPNSQGFTTYGQSTWSLGGEVRFFRALADGCLLGPQDTSYVLGLMRNVTSAQSWGAGSAGYPGALSVAYKGGWGPENGRYQVRQTAVIGSAGHGYVMSLLALPGSGSFSDGTTMLTALAAWARRHLNQNATGPQAGCPQH